MSAHLHVNYQDLRLAYAYDLDGGGMTFGQDYVNVIRERFGKVEHIFEFCAGPGFIGFSLLANGLCDRLTLADINPEAVEACRATVRDNGLQDRVSVYLSNGLNDIPVDEQWDLVVGNPPHFEGSDDDYAMDRRLYDPGMRVHRDFYHRVHRHLKPGGVVMLQENRDATVPQDFADMITEGGLRMVEVHPPRRGRHLSGRLATAARHARALKRKAVLGVERVNDHPLFERVAKNNRLFSRIRQIPGLTMSRYYFILSTPV